MQELHNKTSPNLKECFEHPKPQWLTGSRRLERFQNVNAVQFSDLNVILVLQQGIKKKTTTFRGCKT